MTSFNLESSGSFKSSPIGNKLTIESEMLSAVFHTQSGYLQALKRPGDSDYEKVELEFVKYGVVRGKDRSGAYLFLPDGEAQLVDASNNKVVVVLGPIVSTVHVYNNLLKHKVSIIHSQGIFGQSVSISNIVDITSESNFELVMRIRSDRKNEEGHFFTDLNALQLIKRKYFAKLPLQAQVYPMPSAAYLQDSANRFTLLSAQPLGVASLKKGWLEVFLDRRLMQDDNRGLQQGVLDNKPTPNMFVLAYESVQGIPYNTNSRSGYHTLLAQLLSHSLQYPLFALHLKQSQNQAAFKPSFSPISKPLPCDLNVVNLRTLGLAEDYSTESSLNVLPSKSIALILQRWGIDCNSKTRINVNCSVEDKVSLSDVLGSAISVSSVEETSLTVTNTIANASLLQPITFSPMSLRTFKVITN